MSRSTPPTAAAILRSSPGEGAFWARSIRWKEIRRSLNQRSALRVSEHLLVPKICRLAGGMSGPAQAREGGGEEGAPTPGGPQQHHQREDPDGPEDGVPVGEEQMAPGGRRDPGGEAVLVIEGQDV